MTDPVARFLLALAVVVSVSHLFGALLGRLRQPPVLGEILGGLVLGPSALGFVWPAGRAWLFPRELLGPLDMAAQLGLVTFMFLLGCELHMAGAREHRKVVGFVVVGGIALPFAGGITMAALARPMLSGPASHPLGYLLFFGLAAAITALPVLARILVDLRLERTVLGTISLTSAAIGDAVAWAALTVILALTGVNGTTRALLTAGLAAALVAVTVLAVRPALTWLVRRQDEPVVLPVLAVGAIGYAAITQFIGLHPVIGAFLFGTVVPRGSATVRRIGARLQGFAVSILLPLFFAGVGLNTSIGALGGSARNWLLFGAVLLVANVTKFAGSGGAARLAGLPGDEAKRLGALMNCRGVTELVVATIGLRYQLINQLGFTVLVLVALVTTAATGPLLRLFSRPDRRSRPRSAAPAGR